MTIGRPRLPDSAVVVRNAMAARPMAPGELAIVADVKARISSRGSKRASFEAGISRSHLLSIANGNARITEKIARRLGYRPAWERILIEQAEAEDQALADRIEAEINRPSLLKEAE